MASDPFVRSSLVDPGRRKTYSGRVSACGYIPVAEPGNAGITAADGSPAVHIPSLITGQLGSLLVTFLEPPLKKLNLATVRGVGVFPVYMLLHGGVWSTGRTLLLGDAARAMPPQGESTGVAIEGAMVLAHVF
ncbi:hypothetical protein VTK56DRAFT_3682 [Thermocarpiscus australiensis]